MGIVFGSNLSSTVANATFLDKTQDDSTIGIVSLANTDPASGDSVANAQAQLNANKRIVNAQAAKASTSQFTLNTISLDQLFRPIGDGGAVTLNSLLFSNQPVDGTLITIIGQDDTNTVTITSNDVQYGQILNGSSVTLAKGYSLQFFYDAGLERFIEISRNF